ncbi:alpha/beta hydrolase [Kineosporia sp. R_H_3]|uniref:alpha/beta fold hydrolase n=1 Tax=Kineosporia sp. R_H_3 TaxID=1961848 RepID=UPI00117A4C35
MATRADLLGPARTVRVTEGAIRIHEAGPPDGPVLVFVHGILANADVWRHVVADLSDRYRCVSPDWPLGGHQLPMAAGCDFTLPGLADLVARTLSALDLSDVTLVGNDTGGAICQAVAAGPHEHVGAVVLTPCDAFENFLPLPIRHLQLFGRSAPGLRVIAEALRLRPVHRSPAAFGLLTRRPIPPEIMTSYIAPLRAYPGTRRDFAALVRGISRQYTLDAARALPRFTKPALVAWSRQRFFPLAHGERLAGLLPHARLEILEDSGPFVSEDVPDLLSAALRSFLRSIRPDVA